VHQQSADGQRRAGYDDRVTRAGGASHDGVVGREGGLSRGVDEVRDEVDEVDETAHTVPVEMPRAIPDRRFDPRRRALLRLRRQRLIVLTAAVPMTVGLAVVLAGMWIIVQLLVDAGLVGYVLHLRRCAQSERRLAASRAARDRRIAADRAARRAARGPGIAASAASFSAAGVARSAGRPAALRRTEPARAADAGDDGGPARHAEFEPVRLSEPTGAGAGADVEVDAASASHVAGEQYGELAGSAAETAPEPEGYATGNVRVTGGRSTGRPSARPPTSRPGRVQVNPPGTHGGLTAPGGAAGTPAPATSAPGAAPTGEPAAAGPAQTPDELERLLRRHAVGS
jgi:hypothetical protein